MKRSVLPAAAGVKRSVLPIELSDNFTRCHCPSSITSVPGAQQHPRIRPAAPRAAPPSGCAAVPSTFRTRRPFNGPRPALSVSASAFRTRRPSQRYLGLCTKPMESSKSPQSSKKSRIVPSDTNGPQFDNDDFSSESASNQMVVFNPEAVDKEQDELGENRSLSLQKSVITRGISPSIGAFTVQCAKCFKWRLVPTKEKYEEIRECIMQKPFVCKRAREWRPDVTCDDPEDISQDGSRLWAIDKPNIAQPPRGWERQIRIRGEGGTKFADVYYTSPTGRKLRSLVEVDRYLQENPEYVAQGITSAQFSFQIPRPLRQDYVKKKAKLISPSDEASTITSKSPQPEEVSPLSWAAPTAHEGEASEEDSRADETLGSEVELTRKRKAGSTLSGESNHLSDEPKPKLEDAQNGDTST